MPLILFLIFSLVITYVYFGYPALLWMMTRRKPPIEFVSAETEDRRPSLSLIIPAYNESSVIERKIQNTLSLSYPEDKLEIIVASDGSDDETDEIVKRYADR
ncbi:MAG: glycosyltransferase, partial [Candidatus Latescibacteria bacterium]|nr:glycosyltransferase [Candidatus Latescibacterota bacterium]